MADLPGTPWPVVTAPAYVGLCLLWANPVSAIHGDAEVTFDNAEVWQYPPPELEIALAVIVSWPLTPGNWILKSSATIDGRLQVVVPASNQAQFFRLSH